VAYLRKGKKLPSLDLIRAYQNAIKIFVKIEINLIEMMKALFEGNLRLRFSIKFNQETRQVVIFDRETKIFLTAYKLAERSVDKYLTTGNIGSN
jgi:hypothetical protein